MRGLEAQGTFPLSGATTHFDISFLNDTRHVIRLVHQEVAVYFVLIWRVAMHHHERDSNPLYIPFVPPSLFMIVCYPHCPLSLYIETRNPFFDRCKDRGEGAFST